MHILTVLPDTVNSRSILWIVGTLPVTVCECKRSISILRLIESPLTMVIYHRDLVITTEGGGICQAQSKTNALILVMSYGIFICLR